MRIVLLASALITGCATAVSENDCRTNSWYTVGERDALLGQRPQFERYAADCGRYGVKPDENGYTAGWALGYSEWNQRVSGSRM